MGWATLWAIFSQAHLVTVDTRRQGSVEGLQDWKNLNLNLVA
jgi:hypothetical protein